MPPGPAVLRLAEDSAALGLLLCLSITTSDQDISLGRPPPPPRSPAEPVDHQG